MCFFNLIKILVIVNILYIFSEHTDEENFVYRFLHSKFALLCKKKLDLEQIFMCRLPLFYKFYSHSVRKNNLLFMGAYRILWDIVVLKKFFFFFVKVVFLVLIICVTVQKMKFRANFYVKTSFILEIIFKFGRKK